MADFDLASAKPEFDLASAAPYVPEQHNSFVRGVLGGLQGVKAGIGGVYEAAGNQFGLPRLAAGARGAIQEAQARQAELSAPTDSLEGIHDLGDLGSYAAHTLGGVVPSVLGYAASTAAGTALGGLAGPVGATAGAFAGPAAYFGAQQGGEIYHANKEAGLPDAGTRALLGGAVGGALAAFVPGGAGKLAEGALAGAVPSALEQIAGKSVLGQVSKQALLGSVLGAAQPLISRVAEDKPLGTSDALMEALNAAVPMGVMGGGFAYAHTKSAITQASRELTRRAQDSAAADVAAGEPLALPAPAAEAQPAPEVGPNPPTAAAQQADAQAAQIDQARSAEQARQDLVAAHETLKGEMTTAGVEPDHAMTFPDFVRQLPAAEKTAGIDHLQELYQAHQQEVMEGNFTKARDAETARQADLEAARQADQQPDAPVSAELPTYEAFAAQRQQEAKMEGGALTEAQLREEYATHVLENTARVEGTLTMPKSDLGAPGGTAPEPTAMQLALGTALKRKQESDAYAQQDAGKAQDLDRLANIAKGEQQAEAAARGESPGPSLLHPEGPDGEIAALKASLGSENLPHVTSMPAKLAQDVTAALRSAKNMPDQVKALEALQLNKKGELRTGQYADALKEMIDRIKQENPDALQEPSAGKMDVRQEASDGQGVGEQNAEPGKTASEGGQGDAAGAQGEKVNGAQTTEAVQGEPQKTSSRTGRPEGTTDDRHTVDRRPINPDTSKVDPAASFVSMHPLSATHPLDQRQWWLDLDWAIANKDAKGAEGNAAREVLENGKATDEQVARAPQEAVRIQRAQDLIASINQTQEAIHAAAAKRGLDADIRAVEGSRKAKTVADVLDASDELEAHDLGDFRNEVYRKLTPEAEARLGAQDNPETVKALHSGSMTAVLDTLSKGATPAQKMLINTLRALGLNTQVGYIDYPMIAPNGNVAGGRYHINEDTVAIFKGGASTDTVLHELTHAATIASQREGERLLQFVAQGAPWEGLTPRQQRMATAAQRLDGIFAEAQKLAKAQGIDPYGLTSKEEFTAELYGSKDFQKFLQSAPEGLWQRIVAWVKDLLGAPGSDTLFERALKVTEPFFEGRNEGNFNTFAKQANVFNASPRAAGDIVDRTIAHLTKGADETGDRSLTERLSDTVFGAFVPWKTVQFLGHQMTVDPEMVQHGMDKGVARYIHAYETGNRLMQMVAKPAELLVSKMQAMYRAIGDEVAARKLNQNLSEIGVGSSINGTDYRLNGADNLKADPTLSANAVAQANDYYRQFRALQKTNPEAAQALVEGGQINRRNLGFDVATIARALLARGQGADEQAFNVVHQNGLDITSEKLHATRNGDSAAHLDGASYAIDQNLKALFAAAKGSDLPEGSRLKEQLAELRDIHEHQSRNPYYSAGRDGDYYANVAFKDMDDATWAELKGALAGTNKVLGDYHDQDHAFFRVDTLDQANGLHRKLLAAGGDKIDMAGTSRGALKDAPQIANAAGVSRAMRSILDTLAEGAEGMNGMESAQVAQLRDALQRKAMSLVQETAPRSAKMKREGVPGWDGDFVASFGRRAQGAAQDTSRLYTAPLFADALKTLDDGTATLNQSGTDSGKLRGMTVRDEITKRYNNTLTPTDNEVINRLNSLSHSFYLGAATAFYIRTMAQPIHRLLPILGSRYGFMASAPEIIRAQRDAVRVITASVRQAMDAAGPRGFLEADFNFKDMGFTPKEETFLQEMYDRGVLKLGLAQQLQHAAMTGSDRTQTAVKAASVTAQYAEMTNRLASGLASFRLAERGKDGVPQRGTAENTEYAIKNTALAMDDFDQYNTARAIGKFGFAGRVTPLLTQFMNYSLQTMQQVARTVQDGVFSRDKTPEGAQRASEARKEFLGLMATTTMISGAMGLPFVNAIAGVYNTLNKDEDNPQDIRLAARNAFAGVLGQKGGEIAAHGLGGVLGIDTSSFGLQNLLPGSEFLASRGLMKDRLAQSATQLMGPALNAGMDIGIGLSKMSDGYYVKGIEQMLPSGLKGYFKAGELATRGYTNAQGNPIGLTATPWDIAVQATGLRPQDRAETSELQQYRTADMQVLRHRASVLTDQAFKAITEKDVAGQQDVMAQIAKFNQANPDMAIRDLAGAFRQKTMERVTGEISGTGVGVTSGRQLPRLTRNYSAFTGGMPQ